MNFRGQIWSVDMVLAAAIFTLAVGLVLSQSELNLFYGQQDRSERELLRSTILASNLLASQRDITISLYPQACETNPSQCSGTFACEDGACETDGEEAWYVEDATVNARCGPNFNYEYSSGIVVPTAQGWVFDNELSGLENCLVNVNGPLSPSRVGVTGELFVDTTALLSDGSFLEFYSPAPTTQSYYSFNRQMLVFPHQPSASELRACLDGACPQHLTSVNIRVWRP